MKVNITVQQSDGNYVITKLVNTTKMNIGDTISKEQLDKLIESETKVTIK